MAAAFTLGDLREAGVVAKQLKVAGFTAGELEAAGFMFSQFEYDYDDPTAEQLEAAGFSASVTPGELWWARRKTAQRKSTAPARMEAQHEAQILE
mmetsp:Transcript_65057/g.113428  ORF Transcript_65057/g.113428 Transcript_65057/m.113428 type:complete len:95 (+) Transcript_65057:3-287(+)